MSVSIASFKNLVAPDVLPCPDPIVEREVKLVIDDFCRKTNILQRDFQLDVDSLDIDSDMQNAIDFDISQYAHELRPVTLMELYIDSAPYLPQLRNIKSTITNWDLVSNDRVKYFWIPNDHTVRLFDMSANDTSVWMRITVKPRSDATTVDDLLWEDWSEAIVAGAKWRILSMPGKEWTEPRAGEHFRREYRKYFAQAKAYLLRGGTGVYEESVKWKSFEF